jgi:hypothetical protein
MEKIFRSKPFPFTQIPNRVLYDNNLSSKAKMLYFYLLSLPNGTSFNKKEMLQAMKEGASAMESALSELIAKGLLSHPATPIASQSSYDELVINLSFDLDEFKAQHSVESTQVAKQENYKAFTKDYSKWSWLDHTLWKKYLEYRKEKDIKKRDLNVLVEEELLLKLGQFIEQGYDQETLILTAIRKNWNDFFEVEKAKETKEVKAKRRSIDQLVTPVNLFKK